MWLLACASPDSAVDLGDPVDALVLPDVSDVDFATAVKDAVQLTKSVTMVGVWSAHAALIERRAAGCPDLWAGPPDDDTVEVDAEGGTSWFDHCASGATDYDGWAWFDSTLVAAGEVETAEGRTTDGTRELVADAVIADASGIQLEADGSFSDALSRTDATDYARWTWSTRVSGTVTGTTAMQGSLTPGGWRSDLSTYATGGDADVYEVDGNVFLFDDRLQGRFDSVEVSLAFAGAGAAGPDDCAAEPAGWIGLRDENAYWYDLVFQPVAEDTGAAGGACDGCGELYIRGVGTDLGPACVDFDFVWNEQPLSPPEAADYVLSLHTLEGP